MTPRSRYVIGIPSVWRARGYLAQTVDSVVAAMTESELARARIVVLNADTPSDRNTEVARVASGHAELVRSGTLTLESQPTRVVLDVRDDKELWRRQQVLDCASLIERCCGLGEYYLHLEDDVVAAPGFLAAIDARATAHARDRRRWSILSFYNSFSVADCTSLSERRLACSHFGLIGQLFHDSDLKSLSQYLRAHERDAPVDALVSRWARAAPGLVIAHAPSLFQHVGVFSSFRSEIQVWDTPQFLETPDERRSRLASAVADIKAHHPDSVRDYLSIRARLRAFRRYRFPKF